MVKFIQFFSILFFLIFFNINCGMINATQADKFFYKNDFHKALNLYKKSSSYKLSNSKSLYYLNLGLTYFWSALENDSKTYLINSLRAFKRAEKYNYSSSAITSTIISKDKLPYQIKDYELAYLHFFKSLIYYKLEQNENSMIEIRAAYNYEKKLPFISLWWGLMALQQKKYNDALVSFKLLNKYSELNNFSDFYVGETLFKMNYQNRAFNVFKKYIKNSNNNYFKSMVFNLKQNKNYFNNFSDVVIFIDFPLSKNDVNYADVVTEFIRDYRSKKEAVKNNDLVGDLFRNISFSYTPAPVPRTNSKFHAKLYYNSTIINNSFYVGMLKSDFKKTVGNIVKNLFKDIIKDEARKKIAGNNKGVNYILRGKDSGDMRYWNTLPGNFNAVCLKLKPGIYNLNLHIYNDKNQIVKLVTLNNISIKPNKVNFILKRIGYNLAK